MDYLTLVFIPLGFGLGYLFQQAKIGRLIEEGVALGMLAKEETVLQESKRQIEAELRESLKEDVKEAIRLEHEPRILFNLKDQARQIKSDAEERAEQYLVDAKLQAQSLIEQASEQLTIEKQKQLERAEQETLRLNRREEKLDQRDAGLEIQRAIVARLETETNQRLKQIETTEASIETLRRDLQDQRAKLMESLHTVANLTPEEATLQVIETARSEATHEIEQELLKLEEELKEKHERQAQMILCTAMQRWAGEYAVDNTVKVVSLPDDDMKGKIIGREGRNIRTFEHITGVDVIVDDTPDTIVLSTFDPVRREIARISMERLVADGRIHPARIEEVVEKARGDVDQIVRENGKFAAFELGIHDLHPELLRLLGELKYRTSYGQNMWSHSIEVGFLTGLMAAELGLDEHAARRAGLLHDIGKALTHEKSGPHALVGAALAKKCGESELVRNAIAAHHNEEPQESPIAHLVIAADALSGARPGARREVLASYVKRLEMLEKISTSFDGVDHAYAIQAGREVRVLVEHQTVDDHQSSVLAKNIAQRIENEMVYPGQVKVCVIRETRSIEVAR